MAMDGFNAPPLPKYKVRELADGAFVIDVHWPAGSVEQLIGLLTSQQHAEQWLHDAQRKVRNLWS